jgi:hypothetical protein
MVARLSFHFSKLPELCAIEPQSLIGLNRICQLKDVIGKILPTAADARKILKIMPLFYSALSLRMGGKEE